MALGDKIMILYEGPSMFDGRPIVVIATGVHGATHNRKTGAMIQTWVLRADVSPNEAVRDGSDATVCGSCLYRSGRGCYVRTGEAPLSVWRAYLRGSYASIAGDLAAIAAIGSDRMVRLGSYGDPAAVPVDIWEALSSRSRAHTGYTHAWRRLQNRRWRRLLMASCDLPSDRVTASLMGWRTFRVSDDVDAARQAGEMTCPASSEAGKVKTCEQCHACDGARGEGLTRKDVTIQLHGSSSKRARMAIASLRMQQASV